MPRPLRLRSLVLLGALPEEIAAFRRRIRGGRWHGVRVHLAATGIGKSAAAAVTQRMIDLHRPDAVIVTGAAGALDPIRRIGEIGIALAAIDADFDLRALLPGTRRGEQAFTGMRAFPCDPALAATALAAPVDGLFPAYIATGSAFLDTPGKAAFRASILPELEAEVGGALRRPDLIEMEGSAILQTALANRIPALAIRAVSDAVDGDAVADFAGFIKAAIGRYALVVDHILASAGADVRARSGRSRRS